MWIWYVIGVLWAIAMLPVFIIASAYVVCSVCEMYVELWEALTGKDD